MRGREEGYKSATYLVKDVGEGKQINAMMRLYRYTLSALLLVFANLQLVAANSPLADGLVQATMASPENRGLKLAMASRPFVPPGSLHPLSLG